MRKAYARATSQPNSRAEASFRRTGTILPLNERITQVLQAFWPSKRDMRLAAVTGRTDRFARECLALRAKYSAEDVVALLRTEDGFQILEVAMDGARPAWWRKVQRASKLAALRTSIAKQELALKQLELDFGGE